jgi:hypothetical protein
LIAEDMTGGEIVGSLANKLCWEAPMYALFKGKTQLARTFASEQEVLNAALAEGLVPELQVTDEAGNRRLPADYYIKVVEKTYDPQPDVKPDPQTS